MHKERIEPSSVSIFEKLEWMEGVNVFTRWRELNEMVAHLAVVNKAMMNLCDKMELDWTNGCHITIPEALRYLAEKPRPSGGNDRFNTEHLYGLARELELVHKTFSQDYEQIVQDACARAREEHSDLIKYAETCGGSEDDYGSEFFLSQSFTDEQITAMVAILRRHSFKVFSPSKSKLRRKQDV